MPVGLDRKFPVPVLLFSRWSRRERNVLLFLKDVTRWPGVGNCVGHGDGKGKLMSGNCGCRRDVSRVFVLPESLRHNRLRKGAMCCSGTGQKEGEC